MSTVAGEHSRTVRVGVIHDFSHDPRSGRSHAEVVDDLLGRIGWAESIGIDAVWFPEHHFSPSGHAPSPVPLMAAVASTTRRIRIGTSVLLAPLYEPLRLAEDVALVDLISGGRVDLGLGLGWAADEYAAFGVDPRLRVARLNELVRVLRAAWSDDPLDLPPESGLAPVNVTPKPIQRPHPPLWAGANSVAAGRRTGRHGMGLLSLDPSVVAAYVGGLEAAGSSVTDGRLGGFIWGLVVDDPDEAWPQLRQPLRQQRGRFSRPRYEPGGRIVGSVPAPERTELDRELRQSVVTPAEAIARVRDVQAALPVRLDNVHWFGAIAGVPDAIADRHVELLATVVRPALR